MLIFGFFCISFGTSIFLKTEHAPDEAMRMLIPEYIVSHHTLPNLSLIHISVFNFNQPLMTLYSAESEELSSSVFAASSFP